MSLNSVMFRGVRAARLVQKPALWTRGYASSASIVEDLKSRGPWSVPDYMSPTQSEKLDAALEGHLPVGRHTRIPGELLSPGFHLAYFNPATGEQLLGSDGYENHQAPGEEFPIRMWTGGSIEFNRATGLLLGAPAVCHESIADVKHQEKDGGERIFVTLDRQMKNTEDTSHEWAVRETRSLVYFNAQGAPSREKSFTRMLDPPSTPAAFRQSVVPSPLMLFRYSALTYNGHKIHWDRDFAREEGLPGLIVHGPLTVTMLLRWLSTTVLASAPQYDITSFSYRNLLPMFEGNELTLCCGAINGSSKVPVWIEDHRGSMTVSGTITLGPAEEPNLKKEKS